MKHQPISMSIEEMLNEFDKIHPHDLLWSIGINPEYLQNEISEYVERYEERLSSRKEKPEQVDLFEPVNGSLNLQK